MAQRDRLVIEDLLEKRTVPRPSGRGTEKSWLRRAALLALLGRRVKQKIHFLAGFIRVSAMWIIRVSAMWIGVSAKRFCLAELGLSDSYGLPRAGVIETVMMAAIMKTSKFVTPPQLPAPILVDPREAARLLAISPRKLWDLTSRGEIPSLNVGRLVRYRVSDLHGWAVKQIKSDHSITATTTEAADGQHQ